MPNSELYGFKLIGEMTDQEMVDEIAASQREQLTQMNTDQLRSITIDYRMSIYRNRLIEEAGFKDGQYQ